MKGIAVYESSFRFDVCRSGGVSGGGFCDCDALGSGTTLDPRPCRPPCPCRAPSNAAERGKCGGSGSFSSSAAGVAGAAPRRSRSAEADSDAAAAPSSGRRGGSSSLPPPPRPPPPPALPQHLPPPHRLLRLQRRQRQGLQGQRRLQLDSSERAEAAQRLQAGRQAGRRPGAEQQGVWVQGRLALSSHCRATKPAGDPTTPHSHLLVKHVSRQALDIQKVEPRAVLQCRRGRRRRRGCSAAQRSV